MKAIVKEVGKAPELIEVADTMKAMQRMVDGYVQVVGSRVCSGNFIVNEDGQYMCEYNCSAEGHKFYGTIIYVGPLTATFTDADKEAVKRFKAQEAYGNLNAGRWVWC